MNEAEAVTRSARERFPDSPELTVLSARSLLRQGNVTRAVELLTPLGYGRDDVAASALGWLATAELLRGQPRLAVGAAKRALELDPSSPIATYAMAQALAALGESVGHCLAASRSKATLASGPRERDKPQRKLYAPRP